MVANVGSGSGADVERLLETGHLEIRDQDFELDGPAAGDRKCQVANLPAAVGLFGGLPLDRLDAGLWPRQGKPKLLRRSINTWSRIRNVLP